MKIFYTAQVANSVSEGIYVEDKKLVIYLLRPVSLHKDKSWKKLLKIYRIVLSTPLLSFKNIVP